MGKKPLRKGVSAGDRRMVAALALLLVAILIACMSCGEPKEGDASIQAGAARLSADGGSEATPATAAPATAAPLPELEPKQPLQVNVRLFVPKNDVLTGFVGHYDVEIVGSVQYRGRTFTDPVFSYGANQSEDGVGNLEIFDAADTKDVYAVGDYAFSYYNCDVYRWPFEIGDSDRLEDFFEAMDGVIVTSVPHPRSENGLMCTISSANSFSKYQRRRTNCFYAAALWMFRLGDPTLLGILRASESGLLPDVNPTTVAAEYGHYLEPVSVK